MNKAIIFSDLHVHSHKDRVDRLNHCLEVLHWVFNLAEKHNADHIFFLGDLFHERAKIDVMNYLKTFEVFMQHMIVGSANRDMYLLVGNHDMYHKESWDINSIKPLTAIPRVHIIDKPTQMKIGNKKIDWLPHTENPPKELNALKLANGGAGDLLLGHCAVHGASLNLCYGTKADVIVEYDNDMVAVESSVFSDWPMTILGHYHAAQNLGHHVEFIGSPLELTYGEAFQKKHCILLDLDTMQKTYIENNFSPKHLIVTKKDIQEENYDLNGNFVRIAIDATDHKASVDIRKEITTKYKVLSLDTKPIERKIEEDRTVIEDAKLIFKDTQKMLTTYMDERGVPEGLDKTKLHSIGTKCLEKPTFV